MKIVIEGIRNQGDFDEELVLLKVKDICDAGMYVLCDTTYTADGKISAKLRHQFWLPDKKVEKGDFIRVHTKPGTNSSFRNTSGTTTHDFYWGLKTAVWNNDKDCGVLFEVNEWHHKGVK